MTPADELAEHYAQWRVLTEQEGSGLRHFNWSAVDQCQAAKSRLQPRIAELSSRIEASLHEARFRGTVDELMELERQNGELLLKCRQETEAQILEDNRSCRHLRRLHRLYIPPARQNWQSYS